MHSSCLNIEFKEYKWVSLVFGYSKLRLLVYNIHLVVDCANWDRWNRRNEQFSFSHETRSWPLQPPGNLNDMYRPLFDERRVKARLASRSPAIWSRSSWKRRTFENKQQTKKVAVTPQYKISWCSNQFNTPHNDKFYNWMIVNRILFLFIVGSRGGYKRNTHVVLHCYIMTPTEDSLADIEFKNRETSTSIQNPRQQSNSTTKACILWCDLNKKIHLLVIWRYSKVFKNICIFYL